MSGGRSVRESIVRGNVERMVPSLPRDVAVVLRELDDARSELRALRRSLCRETFCAEHNYGHSPCPVREVA